MVKKYFFLCVFFCCFMLGISGEPQLNLRLRNENVVQGQSIVAQLVIKRSPSEVVDETSFEIDNDTIQAQRVSSSHQRSISIINGAKEESVFVTDIYEFVLPAKEEGWYVLGPVSVLVDNNKMISETLSIHVSELVQSDRFRLEAAIQGPIPVFPGQRLTFIYKVFYKDKLELTHQNFSLFSSESFKKIGTQSVRDYIQGGMRVYELSQEVEAVSAGRFTFTPSEIQALIYEEDFFGRRRYQKTPLVAMTEEISVIVKSIPIENQPTGFAGAIGDFQISSELKSSDNVGVGDKLLVHIRVEGEGAFHTVLMPRIQEQDEFLNDFRMSGISSLVQEGPGFKEFQCELRALNSNVQSIPSILFTYFNPDKEEFLVSKTDAISIVVNQISAPEPMTDSVENHFVEEFSPTTVAVKESEQSVNTVPIYGNYVLGDVGIPWWRTKKVLFFTLGVVLILLVFYLFKKQCERTSSKLHKSTSRDYLEKARACRELDGALIHYLKQAFLQRFHEHEYIDETVRDLDEGPSHPVFEEMKEFIHEIESMYYSKTQDLELVEVMRKAEELYKRVL